MRLKSTASTPEQDVKQTRNVQHVCTVFLTTKWQLKKIHLVINEMSTHAS